LRATDNNALGELADMSFTKATAIITNLVGTALMAAAIQTTIPAEFVADDSDPVVSKDYDVQPYAPPMAKPTVVTLANMVVAGRVPTHRAKRPCTEGYRVIGYTDTTFSTFRGVYTRCGL
jgi:hypothetical protein